MTASSSATIQGLLRSGDFKLLFIEWLGWDRASGTEAVELGGERIELRRIAQKRGLQVFECRTDRVTVQTARFLRKLQERVSVLAYEHILIVADPDATVQVWAWAYRDRSKERWQHRLHPCFSSRVPDELVSRIEELTVLIEDEESLSLLDVSARAVEAFDHAPTQTIFFRSPGYARQSDELAKRMRTGGEVDFHEFVVFHLQLAVWFARRYGRLAADLSIEPEDLVQVATIGLTQAARTFDPGRGAAFSTYAFRVMQTACWRYLPSVVPLGRLPDYVFQPFIEILAAREIAWRETGPAGAAETFERTASEAGFTREVAEDLRRFFEVQSFEGLSRAKRVTALGIAEQECDSGITYREPLNDLLVVERDQLLHRLLDALDERTKLILQRRFGLSGSADTLEVIARDLELTRERVRQLESQGLASLRRRAAPRLGHTLPGRDARVVTPDDQMPSA